MGGRITNSEKQLRPDAKYSDKRLAKFINCIMVDGRKSAATRVVYDAMDIIQDRLKKDTHPENCTTEIEVFHKAIDRVSPPVEVRSKRIGGANYQVPLPVNRKRQQSLAFRWIITSARGERGRPMSRRLADELYAASKGEGKAMSTREQTIRMAEANRAFSHYRW